MPEADAADPPERQRPDSQASGQPRIGRLVWWLGLGASGLVAGVLSLQAYAEGLPSVLDGISEADKGLHFMIGGSLAFFLDGILRRRMVRKGSLALPLAAILLLVPAAIEEFLQRYSLNRTSSFGDFAADVVGVAFFIWLSRRVDSDQKPA